MTKSRSDALLCSWWHASRGAKKIVYKLLGMLLGAGVRMCIVLDLALVT